MLSLSLVQQIVEHHGPGGSCMVLSNPTVTAPIVGATRASHLDDAVAALDIELSDELERLTSPIPHQPAGF